MAHNSSLGNHVVVVNGALVGGYVEVADRAFISANCLLHQCI
jgi:UDP-N-acetylglucosamine acyltransferase